MNQLDLFTTLARRTDPATSHEAAARVQVRASQQTVLRALHGGPGTSDELYRRLEGVLSPSRVRGALKELLTLGSVRVCGIGQSDRGGKAQVYERISGCQK
jgi:hypothetical protein